MLNNKATSLQNKSSEDEGFACDHINGDIYFSFKGGQVFQLKGLRSYDSHTLPKPTSSKRNKLLLKFCVVFLFGVLFGASLHQIAY